MIMYQEPREAWNDGMVHKAITLREMASYIRERKPFQHVGIVGTESEGGYKVFTGKYCVYEANTGRIYKRGATGWTGRTAMRAIREAIA